MRRRMAPLFALFLALALAPAGCAKAPDTRAAEMLKAGDRAGALSLLEGFRAKKPGALPTRYLLFVLYQNLAAQGEPARHEAYLQSAIAEYSWIAREAGLSADYRDMEGSLKSTPATRAAYEAAYNAVYAR